jgi:hypothetical protein
MPTLQVTEEHMGRLPMKNSLCMDHVDFHSHDETDGLPQVNKLIDAWLGRKPAHFFEAE